MRKISEQQIQAIIGTLGETALPAKLFVDITKLLQNLPKIEEKVEEKK